MKMLAVGFSIAVMFTGTAVQAQVLRPDPIAGPQPTSGLSIEDSICLEEPDPDWCRQTVREFATELLVETMIATGEVTPVASPIATQPPVGSIQPKPAPVVPPDW